MNNHDWLLFPGSYKKYNLNPRMPVGVESNTLIQHDFLSEASTPGMVKAAVSSKPGARDPPNTQTKESLDHSRLPKGKNFKQQKTQTRQQEMEELKQQILNKSGELFMRYGIKSISMDDIARKLGISKKTLYQYVDNKNELIEQIFEAKICLEKTLMAQIHEEASDAVDEMLRIARYIMDELRQVSPTTMYDLQKYYRSIWKKVEALHQKHVYQILRDNMERGIEQGLYRADLDADIIAKLYVAKTTLVTDEDLFPIQQYGLQRLFAEFITYHMHGIASEKGLQLMRRHQEAARQHQDPDQFLTTG